MTSYLFVLLGCGGAGAGGLAEGPPSQGPAPDGPGDGADTADSGAPPAGGDSAGHSAGGDSAGGDSGVPGEGGLLGPIERDGRFVLEFGAVWFEVDPALGARVTRFTVGGEEGLTDATVDAGNWGSTFWTSPQSDWGWPPVAALDSGPWTGTVDGETIVLTSPSAAVGGGTVVAEKRYTFEAATGAVIAAYTLKNAGASPVSLAGWEVTRVPMDGLVVFPEAARPTALLGSPPLTEQDGYAWIEPAAASGAFKLAADGARGWVARISSRGTVLLKASADVPSSEQAPGEGEVEVYSAGAYVEVEGQGPYRLLAAGESATWTVRWVGRTLPAGTAVTVGSVPLLEAIEGMVPSAAAANSG